MLPNKAVKSTSTVGGRFIWHTEESSNLDAFSAVRRVFPTHGLVVSRQQPYALDDKSRRRDSGRYFDYGPKYAGIKGGDGEVGGLRPTSEIQKGGPLVILYSRDLEQSLTAVRSAVGEILKEPFSFPGGRRFHFADPSGNELAVWSDR